MYDRAHNLILLDLERKTGLEQGFRSGFIEWLATSGVARCGDSVSTTGGL